MSAPSVFERVGLDVNARRRDGDLAWLGLLLSVVSAFLMVGLVWWFVS
ncbi:hypothetical protein GCM10022197_42110 [Microlunatus spumicola]|uniref:Uncharacterized protein n=1 Tax=Microlunatus spumicola TaxID=81499 RepID=A0ABP6YAD3_9ACTN